MSCHRSPNSLPTILLALLLFTAAARAAEPVPLTPLTNAQQVLDLGVEGARRNPHPVRVRGVVTYSVPGRNWLFVQDDTAGLLVIYTNRIVPPLFGQQVEVAGAASAGQFAAECVNAQVRVLGPAPMPVARRSQAERLVAGEDCGRWVELEGRVRDVAVQSTELTLLISSERWQFHAIIALTNALPLPLDWLDAKIRLRGVCWTETDRENKPSAFRIHCAGTNQLTLLEPGRADVFALPLVSPAELRRRTTNSDGRIRVAGTVLMHSPGRRLYLQDDLGPVRTRLLLPFLRGSTAITYVERPYLVALEPGDRVEVIAAPAATAYTPLLGEAEYRKVGTGPPPVPVHRSIEQLTSGHHSGELVTLRARLLDHISRRDGAGTEQELTLEWEGRIFQAVISTSRSNVIERLTPNSMVQVTGICSAGAGEWERFRSFRLLLRTAADVRALGPAPFWTLWPVGRILSGATVLGLAALGWIWLLRRRVAQRTAALAASEAHTRLIIDTALDAVVTMDTEGNVCGWSAQAEKIFGWARTEAMGRTVAELIIPERYREAHTRGLKHLLATGQGTVVNRRIEISASRKDGREFPVELSIVAMKSNGAWNFSAFARDLSERKQAETAIAEGEARMKTVLAHAPEAIMAFDADTGRFIEANENTARLFGLSRAELLQLGPGEVSPPTQPNGRASADVVREKIGEALAGGAPVFEWTHRNARGIEIPCEVRLARLPAAGRNLCIGTVTDISERKRAEAAVLASEARLRESEDKFRTAFRATPALISLVRLRDYRVVEVNETFVEVTGYAKEEIIGRTTLELGFWLEPAHRAEFFRLWERDGSVHEFECGFRMKSGHVLRLLLSAERIEIQGEPCILAMSVDITERKRAEQELHNALAREKELGELKSSFVSMVSHEFRTPLGIIMSATENLENYLERLQPAERAELLADIRSSTQRMSGLMQEVLLLARVDAGKLACRPVPLNLHAFLERVIIEVRNASDHACAIELDLESGAARVQADESLLRHTFSNLLSNAVKYSPPGQPVRLQVTRDADSVVFTVRDEGIGIPATDQKQLFQTFQRGSNVGERPGTGLGLVIVKRCVDLHGGTLQLESRLNAGTTVTVRLPLFGEVERNLS